jgi:diguanylate cyclase
MVRAAVVRWLEVPGRPGWQRAARVVAALMLATNLAYAVSVLIVTRSADGYATLWEGWVFHIAATSPAVLAAFKAFLDGRRGSAWWLVAAGAVFNSLGSILYTYHDQNLDPVPFPAWADGPWLASYAAFAVALVLVTQRPGRQQSKAVRLDGLVIGLSAGAVAVGLWFDSILAQTGGPAAVVVGLAYPLFDLVFVVVIVSGLAPVGFRPDWSSAAFMAGAGTFAWGDIVFLQQVQADTYRPATVLELTWVLGIVLYGLAPWLPSEPRHRHSVESDGVLTVVPAMAALAALTVIALGTSGRLPELATWLAITAIATVLVRVRLTIRELRTANEGFRQARTDDLTGLLNRRGFGEETDRRLGVPAAEVALMMIDLNGFKEINDSLGHGSGDQLLTVVAKRFARAVTGGTIVARLGGDEFGVVVSGARAEVEAAADAILSCLEDPIRLDDTLVRVSASIGVALAPADGTQRDELIRAADVAMYDAKRNQHPVAWYTAARDPHTRERLALIEELRTAIEDRAFTMHFQPAISLATGAVVGVEALVRWNHPQRGTVPPDEFIPLAERVGLIPGITRAVLELSIAHQAATLAAGHHLRFSVNISAIDLVDDDLPRFIGDVLDRNGVPPQLLTLEITETALCRDTVRAEQTLLGLRNRGMRISIDDFGVGYSSMSQLLSLPVDELKIDRTFVTGLAEDRRAQGVLRATVELARTLGLEVTAEGVETEDVLRHLILHGVDQAQGYYFSRPLPGPDLDAFLTNQELHPGHEAVSRARTKVFDGLGTFAGPGATNHL